MNKQDYLQSRNQNQIHIGFAYEYYMVVKHPTPKVHIQIFEQILPHYLQVVGNMDGYFNYFDQKFEVRKLIGVNGSIKYI